jgi:hypothetical protein
VTTGSARLDPRLGAGLRSQHYLVAGIPCAVTAPPTILRRVDSVYGPFRVDALADDDDVYAFRIEPAGAGFAVRDSNGLAGRRVDENGALATVLNSVASMVVRRLAATGIYAIHAASLRNDDGVVIVSGRSGAGKTTLALGMLGRGFRLLSDEYALALPDSRTIAPYRRSIQIRSGTPELVGELEFLLETPIDLGTGPSWSLSPEELDGVFPGCLGASGALRDVVLLAERTAGPPSALEEVSPAHAALELVRATPAAAEDFAGALERMTRLVSGCRCVRLHPRSLESSLELLVEWLGHAGG